MSNYFAALTRSAGPLLERREPLRNHPNIVEQDVERVADSPGIAHASSPLPHAEPATIAAAISDHDSEPVTMPTAPLAQRMPMPTVSPQSASAHLPEALVRNAAVNAALRWVAADPARQQASSTTSTIDETSRRAASPIKQQIDALPPTVNDSDSPDAGPAWIEIQTALPAARDRAQRPEHARTLSADATLVDRRAGEPAQLHEERVEVSIGTIHVRVDAPSSAAVVAQPMQASQPRPERREEHSSFSRCRIPRI